MSMNKRKLGAVWEQAAADLLRREGYVIFEKNYICRAGEIDIVAGDGDTLCFVEVKYRKSNKYGSSVEAVGASKQNTIRRAALDYLARRNIAEDIQCRFDVVGFDFGSPVLIKNAF